MPGKEGVQIASYYKVMEGGLSKMDGKVVTPDVGGCGSLSL